MKMIWDILWQMAGIDTAIMAACPPRWQAKYRRGAIGMAVIGLMCMVSGAYLFWIIFGNLWAAVPFSFVWALILLNLYRLVLITVGNPHIPHHPRYRFPFGSFLFRTLFLLVLGIFIVKPIELLVFQARIQPVLDEYRLTVLAEHEARLEAFRAGQTTVLFENADLSVQRANEGGFLIQRMLILHREVPWVWALSALSLWVFMWPFWARVAWRTRSAYEIQRGEIEKNTILREYAIFKARYGQLMLHFSGRDDIWEEHYHDMPFKNEPIEWKENDYMRPGSVHAWARIFAKEEGADERGQ